MSPLATAIVLVVAGVVAAGLFLALVAYLWACNRAHRWLRPCEWLYSIDPKWLDP